MMFVSTETDASLLWRMRDLTNCADWYRFCLRYEPIIHGYCRRRGLQHADASDVAQDVLLALAKSIERFSYDPIRGSFRSWLFTVTRNTLNNFVNRRAREPRRKTDASLLIAPAETSPMEQAEETQVRSTLLDQAMREVRGEFQPSTWTAFELVAMQGISAAEASERLGISVQAVYIARCRVTKRLQRRICYMTGNVSSERT